MNAGAGAASGDVLWFLHVDVKVPPDCLIEIGGALSHDHVAGGFFRIRMQDSRFIYRLHGYIRALRRASIATPI